MIEKTPKEPKFRHEFKYLCTDAQLAILKVRLMNIMEKDPHVGPNGIYCIKSLYFDDYNDRCYWENEDGIAPREKYRIRIYNNDSARINLECKRKENDKIHKKSCKLTMEQFEYLAYGKGIITTESLPPLAQKLQILRMTSGMKPKVIVEYERTPYVYKNGNVRITFDRNITSSSQVDQFFNADAKRRPILPAGTHLLEVKYDEYLPDPIYHALMLDNMQRTNFSKYFLCRKYSI